MARKGHGRSTDLVNLSSYPDDGSSPVGSNEWNKNRDTTGIIGFTKKTEAIDGSNNINITDSYIEVTNAGTIHTMSQVTTALSTTYYPSDTTTKSFAEGDLLYIVKASGVGTVNLNHQQGGAGAGKITTLSGGVQTLDEKVPRIFMCRTIDSNQEWIEYGGGSASDLDTTNFASGIIDTDISSVAGTDTTIPSAKAVKTYVDDAITAEDLDTAGDSGTGAVDLNSQSLTVSGGTGITTTASNQAITVAGDVGIGDNKLLQANANVADDDFLRIDGTKVEGRTAAQVKSDLDLEIGTDVQAFSSDNALTTHKISDFASSTSAELAGKITGETGTGALVFGTSPALTTPTATQLDVLAQGELRLQDASGGQYVGLKAPTTVTNYTLTLPAATGSNDEVLKTNGSGVLSWGSAGGGATNTHAYTNQSTTTYAGTGTSGTGIDVNTTVATEASGAGEREIFIKKIDANNEGVFAIIHKNGKAVEVQIA